MQVLAPSNPRHRAHLCVKKNQFQLIRIRTKTQKRSQWPVVQTIGLQYVLSIDFYRLIRGATCAKARGPSLLMRRQWIDWCKRTYASRCWLRSRAHKKKYLTPQYFQVVSRLKIRFCKSNWSREIEFEIQSITVNNLSSSFSAVIIN